VRVRNCDITLLLYDGYDWPRTRRTIEEEVKEMRKRLAKIRQLVASGQTQEPISDDTSALLFNSVYIGLNEDVDVNEPDALIAAIDDELRDDFETGTQSSWQTVQQPGSSATAAARGPGVRVHGKKLTRSRGPSMEFRLSGLNAEVNNYGENSVVVSRTFATVRDLEILDHIKTSTWKKFLTALRSDSKGNIRETGANMVRIELHSVRPSLGSTSEEARLRVRVFVLDVGYHILTQTPQAKLLPLRLYVDQDAVDFLKKFFSFQDPNATPNPTPGSPPQQEAYIRMCTPKP
jgi:autophagy-related protein 2